MSVNKRLGLGVVLVVAIALAYLLLTPVPITPAAWTPPAAPTLTGQYQQNTRLAPVQKLSLGEGHNPEDVALDADGKIYAGFEDGRIMVLQPDGTQPRVFANTGGRPLGLVFDRSGNLIVADAVKGLLSVNKAAEIKVLAAEADGVRFGGLNDLDVGADGTIYFTEASAKYPMSQFTYDLLEHQPNGRLLALDPQSQKPRTLFRGLYFANGVAVSPDQSFVLVAETGKYRIRRVWLKEPKMGQSDVFIDNLPGFPDGISSNGRDKFWLALVTPRQALFRSRAPAVPILAQAGGSPPRIPPPRAAAILVCSRSRSKRPRRRKPPKRFPRLLRRNRQRRGTQQHPLLRQHRRRLHRPPPSALTTFQKA